jgi:hypothetical protein
VLKNAVTALEAKVGAWDLDEAPPVVIQLSMGHLQATPVSPAAGGVHGASDASDPPAQITNGMSGTAQYGSDAPRTPQLWKPQEAAEATGDLPELCGEDKGSQPHSVQSSGASSSSDVHEGMHERFWELSIKVRSVFLQMLLKYTGRRRTLRSFLRVQEPSAVVGNFTVPGGTSMPGMLCRTMPEA